MQFRQQETVQIEWVMEGITDKGGAVLAENNEHTPSEERYQMMIDFQRDEGSHLSTFTSTFIVIW